MGSVRASWPALAVGALVVAASNGVAPMYMKYDGVDGDVSASGHDKWIEVHSFQMGVHRAPAGSGGDAPAGLVFGELTILKHMDKTTPLLAKALVENEQTPTLTLDLTTGNDPAAAYFQLTLKNAMVTSMSATGSTGEAPMEHITLNYEQIVWKYVPADATGVAGGPVVFGWDTVSKREIAG